MYIYIFIYIYLFIYIDITGLHNCVPDSADVHLISKLSYRDHKTPSMKECHCYQSSTALNINCLLMLAPVNNRSPAYFTGTPVSTSSLLRSYGSAVSTYPACKLYLEVELFPSGALRRGTSFQTLYEILRML